MKPGQAKRLKKTGGTTVPTGSYTQVGVGKGADGYTPKRPGIGPGMLPLNVSPAGIATSGAPGGPTGASPAGPGNLPPPTTPARQREREEGGFAYGQGVDQAHNDIYQAALKYGDPAVTALYGEAQDDGTGALPTIARNETEGKRQNALAHNANNTFFSGANLRDVNNITSEADRQRSTAWREFQQAEHDYHAAIAKLESAHNFEGEGYDEADENEFLEGEPAPKATGGGKKKKPPRKKKGKK